MASMELFDEILRTLILVPVCYLITAVLINVSLGVHKDYTITYTLISKTCLGVIVGSLWFLSGCILLLGSGKAYETYLLCMEFLK
ncbi:hypothetical protein [Vibrio phage LV6]|nr:hypothetical protein [Vibrio phage LV6]